MRKLALRANEIAHVASLMAKALCNDSPETASAGFAVDGLATLATTLANDMLATLE